MPYSGNGCQDHFNRETPGATYTMLPFSRRLYARKRGRRKRKERKNRKRWRKRKTRTGAAAADIWSYAKKMPPPSSSLSCRQLHTSHSDKPPSSDVPLTYTGVLQREKTREHSGHQQLRVNPLLLDHGKMDFVHGVPTGRKTGPL